MADALTTSVDATAVGPSLPFGRERQREAQAYADWNVLRGNLSMPLAEGCDPAKVREGSTTYHVIRPDKGKGPAYNADDNADLNALSLAILARWAEIAAATGPLRASMRTSGDIAWRGILLPFAHRGGRLGAVQAVGALVGLPQPVDLDGVGAVMANLASVPPRLPAASPWSTGSDASRLLASPCSEPLDIAERLSVARTWAALGAGGIRPGRLGHLHAALTGAFDLLIAPQADSVEMSPVRAADLVFGATAPASERVAFGQALAYGKRLGLDRDGFAALLERFPDGFRGLAMAEGRSRSEVGQITAPVIDELVLEPVDRRLLLGLVRRPRRADCWTPQRAAA